MSSDPLFGEPLFGEGPSAPVFPERVPLTIELGIIDLTNRLWHNHLNGTLSQDGDTCEIWLDYSDEAELPPVGSRFTITLSIGRKLIFQCRDVGTVLERYAAYSIAENVPVWVHTFACVDPLTVLNDQILPDSLRPMVNTTTGAVLAACIAAMDASLILNLAPGFPIASVNFSDFSTFGDLRKSEITRSGQYVLRMEDGLNVRGSIDTDFPAQSDWAINQDDFRYTPSRFKVSPGANKITSVKVTPSGDVPLYRGVKVSELDGRAMSGVTLEGKIFGLDQSEAFKLTAGEDISDPKLWEQSGSIDTSGSAILLNGTLINLEARPFVFPFMVSWAGIIPDEGTGYEFGFQDGNGNWLWSVSSSDYALEQAIGDDEHTYEIYTLPSGSGNIEIWGYHLHQNFTVDATAQISTVVSVDYANNIIVLAGSWNIDNNYIRFVSVDDGTERGRTRIFHRAGATLECDVLPPGIEAGDSVTRGESADSIETITKIKDVIAPGPYGLPAVSGTGVHLQTFSVQRTGQIEGYLLSERDSMPDQTYPRALKLDVDSTEFSDGTVSGSGSGASVALNTKYSASRDFMMAFNYVIGGKRDFKSTCGSGGGGIVIPVTESDPVKLQAIADRICDIGSRNWPRVTSDMHSPMIEGMPTPGDPLPLNFPAPYRVDAASVPILTTRFTHVGATSGSDISDEDVLMLEMEAGEKSPSERAIEESLRGTVLAKFPIQLATIGGARVTGVSWDDVTLSALVSGVSAVYGPKGQLLNLASGIDPAREAGIADPNAGPISLRCHADGGNSVRDFITFELIYPPKPVIQESVTCHYNALTNLVTYHINRPSGALAFDIQRLLDPEGDGTYVYTNIARQVSNDVPLPYEPNSKSIKIRCVGLCDKLSGDYVELDCVLPPLPAPTTLEVTKVKSGGVIKLRISKPPTGPDITGRAKFCRVLVKREAVGDPAPTSRSDYSSDSDIVGTFDVPIGSKTGVWRGQVTFEDTDADDVIWIAATWLDGFGDEGAMTVPFDATNPPVTVGVLSTANFWQSPTPGLATGLANQALGGTVEDDNDETAVVDFSGVFRAPLGQNNSQVKIKFEESLPDPAHGYADGAWTGNVFHSPVTDVTDGDVDNGYVDIDMKQYFRWSKKKHRTYRPTKIIYIGPKIRERGVANDQATRETVYLVGYDSTVESAPAIVKYSVDAVFDKHLFEFRPGVAGLANNLTTVSAGTIDQLIAGFVYHWPRLDGVEIRRYILLIHTAVFGTKGPGSDPAIGVALDALVDQGQITVYNAANTVRNVNVQVLDVGDIGKHRFDTGDVIGSITITAGTTYFVSILAQGQNGRWSVDLSTILNTSSGTSFVSDRDQANWINTSGAATASQAALVLIPTKKNLWFGWSFPTHLISAPDDLPHPVKYGYKLRAGDDSNNWFDRVNPGTPITVDANAEFFTTALETIVASMKGDMAAIFQAQGLKGAVRIYNYVAGILTAGPWTAYTAGVTIAGDPISTDTAVPSSLTTPVLQSTPQILKATGMHADANSLEWQSTDVVFKVVDDAGALINYINPATNAPTATEATAKINVKSGHHNLPITRTQLLVFGGPSNRNVRVYYYVNNKIGSSLKSPDSLSLPFSSILTDLQAQDSTFPTSLTTPTIIPKKDGLIVVKGIQATANNKSMLYDELVIEVVDSSNLHLGYLDPASITGTAAAGSEALARIRVPDAMNYPLKARKDDLITVWGNQFLRAYYYATNQTASNPTPSTASASVAITALGTDSVGFDLAAPSGLGVPNFGFEAKAGFTFDNLTVTTDIHTLKQIYVVLYDGGTTYFDLPTYFSSNGVTVQAAASEATARYKVKLKGQGVLGVRLANAKTILGATAKLYFYAENDIGISAKSTDSTGLTLANQKDITNSKDVIVRVSSGIYPPGKQILLNANFLQDNGSTKLGCAAQKLRWYRYDKSSTPILGLPSMTGAGFFGIATTNTDPIYWNRTGRCVVFNDTTQMLIQNVQTRLMPGEAYSIPTVKVKSSGTPTGMSLRIYFRRDTDGANNLDNINNGALAYGEILLTGLNTTFQEFGGPMKFKDSPALDDGAGNYTNQILCIELAGTLGGATISITDLMFSRTLMPVAFDIQETEYGIISSGLLPTLVPSNDLTNPVGVDGGWSKDPGLGGLIDRLAQ